MLINIKNGLMKGTMSCISGTLYCCDFVLRVITTALKLFTLLILAPLIALHVLLEVCV